mgnify:CR=1 FL=1
MQYRKFILSLTDDGAQEAELNRFLRGHRIVKVEQHFMADDALWAFLVCYLDGEQKESTPAAHRSGERFDPAKELTGEQLVRYQRYAAVRLQLARRDNVKAFVVFTNRELGELAKQDSLTLDTLRRVDGVGDARISQYGEDFVRLVAEAGSFSDTKDDDHEAGRSFDGADSAS